MSKRIRRQKDMKARMLAMLAIVAVAAFAIAAGCSSTEAAVQPQAVGVAGAAESAQRMVADGRTTFRHDTFGSEDFWGGTLRLHQAIAGAANGGVGPGVSPKTALAVGLKVDADAHVHPGLTAAEKSDLVEYLKSL